MRGMPANEVSQHIAAVPSAATTTIEPSDKMTRTLQYGVWAKRYRQEARSSAVSLPRSSVRARCSISPA